MSSRIVRSLAVSAASFAIVLSVVSPAGASAQSVTPDAQQVSDPAPALPPIRQRESCAKPSQPGYAHCHALVNLSGTTVRGIQAAGASPMTLPAGYGPADIQSAYGLNAAMAGSGPTVAIVDAFDNPNA